MMNWTKVLALSAVLAFTASSFAQTTRPSEAEPQAKPGVAVVEIFTSEGCSSCPPADDYVKKLADHFKEKGYRGYTLAWHVHYWDYLGWKDRFGSKAISKRQGLYSKVSGRKGQWTPHITVNGRTHFGGQTIYQGIMKDLNTPTQGKISIKAIADQADQIHIKFDVAEAPQGAVLVVVIAENDLSSNVTAGENKGRTLHHHAVVRNYVIDELKASKGTLTLKVPSDVKRENAILLSYLQDGKKMNIYNAVESALPVVQKEAKASVEDPAMSELFSGFPEQKIGKDGHCEDGVCVLKPEEEQKITKADTQP